MKKFLVLFTLMFLVFSCNNGPTTLNFRGDMAVEIGTNLYAQQFKCTGREAVKLYLTEQALKIEFFTKNAKGNAVCEVIIDFLHPILPKFNQPEFQCEIDPVDLGLDIVKKLVCK